MGRCAHASRPEGERCHASRADTNSPCRCTPPLGDKRRHQLASEQTTLLHPSSFLSLCCRSAGSSRLCEQTHATGFRSKPIPSSLPSRRYPRPQISQCVNGSTSLLALSSCMSILYRGGMSGKGKLSIRSEKTKAGRLLNAGDGFGSSRRCNGEFGDRVEVR